MPKLETTHISTDILKRSLLRAGLLVLFVSLFHRLASAEESIGPISSILEGRARGAGAIACIVQKETINVEPEILGRIDVAKLSRAHPSLQLSQAAALIKAAAEVRHVSLVPDSPHWRSVSKARIDAAVQSGRVNALHAAFGQDKQYLVVCNAGLLSSADVALVFLITATEQPISGREFTSILCDKGVDKKWKTVSEAQWWDICRDAIGIIDKSEHSIVRRCAILMGTEIFGTNPFIVVVRGETRRTYSPVSVPVSQCFVGDLAKKQCRAAAANYAQRCVTPAIIPVERQVDGSCTTVVISRKEFDDTGIGQMKRKYGDRCVSLEISRVGIAEESAFAIVRSQHGHHDWIEVAVSLQRQRNGDWIIVGKKILAQG